MPTVGDAFINPAYRLSKVDSSSRVWDEAWWDRHPVRDDLVLFFGAHLTSPASTMRPTMILGHPGSGKSLLLKVIAGRLPADLFTVVHVPLRIVDPSTHLYDQVQQALARYTGRQLDWADLSVFGDTTVRVLLLDGIDEMIDQVGVSRANYLEEIAEFQRRESALGRPVAVVVTGRTVLADRIRIPKDSLAVRIEPFDDWRIEQWLNIWNVTNASAITHGTVIAIPTKSALAVPELARFPIVLLILTLYWAVGGIDQNARSSVRLYESLTDRLTRREIAKRATSLETTITHEAVRIELWRLGIVAFGAFNRGRQTVSEDELRADLDALSPEPTPERYSVAAAIEMDNTTELLGRFFFIYAPDARYSSDNRRSYEFLHATFGEYFIAANLVNLLKDMATFSNVQMEHGAWKQPISDDLICALLSHRLLSERPTVLSFAEELMDEVSLTTQQDIASLLESLISRSRSNIQRLHNTEYHPTNRDGITAVAAYSANLILLRLFSFRSLPTISINSIASAGVKPLDSWKVTVRLWGAALDAHGWASIIGALNLADGQIVRRREPLPYDASIYIAEAELRGEQELAEALRIGFAANTTAI